MSSIPLPSSSPGAATLPDLPIAIREHFLGRLHVGSSSEKRFESIAHPKAAWCADADLILQRLTWHRPLPSPGRPEVGRSEDVESFLRRVLARLDFGDQSAVEWLAADADDPTLVTVQLKGGVCAADVSAKYYKRRSVHWCESIHPAQFHQLQCLRAHFRATFDICYDRFKFERTPAGVVKDGCTGQCQRSHQVDSYHRCLRQAMAMDGIELPLPPSVIMQQPPSNMSARMEDVMPPLGSPAAASSSSSSAYGRSQSRGRSRLRSPSRPRRLTPSRSRSRDRQERNGGSPSSRTLHDTRHPDRRAADNSPLHGSAPSSSSSSAFVRETIHHAGREHFSAILSIGGGGSFNFTSFSPSPIGWTTDDLLLSLRLVLVCPSVPLPIDRSPGALESYLLTIHGLIQQADGRRDILWLGVDALDPTLVTIQLRTESVSAIGFMAAISKRWHAQGLAWPRFYPTSEYQTMTRLQSHHLCEKFFSNLRAHGRIRGCDQGEAPACARGSHDVATFNRAMDDWQREDKSKMASGETTVAAAAAAATAAPVASSHSHPMSPAPLPPVAPAAAPVAALASASPSARFTFFPPPPPMMADAAMTTSEESLPALPLIESAPAPMKASFSPTTSGMPLTTAPAALSSPMPAAATTDAAAVVAPASSFIFPPFALASTTAAAAASVGISSSGAAPAVEIESVPEEDSPPGTPNTTASSSSAGLFVELPTLKAQQQQQQPQPAPSPSQSAAFFPAPLPPPLAPVQLPESIALPTLPSDMFAGASLFGTSLCPEEHYPLGSLLFDPSLELERVVDQPPSEPFRGTLDVPYDFLMPARDTLHPTYRRELDQRGGDLSAASRLKDGMFAVGQLKKFGVLKKDDSGLRLAYRLGADQQYQLLMHFLTTTDRDDFVARLEARRQAPQQAVATKAR